MPEVEWSNRARKQLFRIDSRYREMIFDKVGELTTFPDVKLDLKKLRDRKDPEYRLRVGDYRVIFTVINNQPRIIRIDEVKRRQSNTY